ncbi:hypothetical protein H7U08_23345 [Bacillus cereus]|uniref:Uncharacterized protein n=1 Tax=Bacillus cereus TaxID=1396 RepID=A0AAW4QXN2_BACCE|nr:hypothetical protein [Bacillus cereus]MBY0039448.1 hypothetical protein [Bacillus cereus]
MKYHELFNTLKPKQVAKREFQEEFSCNDKIIAIFIHGEREMGLKTEYSPARKLEDTNF